jgi:hypothetical protein
LIYYFQNESINGHHKNVKFLCADVTSPDLNISDESVDLIFSNWLLMYLSDKEVIFLVTCSLHSLIFKLVLFFKRLLSLVLLPWVYLNEHFKLLWSLLLFPLTALRFEHFSIRVLYVYLLLSIDLAFSSLRVEESSIHVLYSCAFYLLSAIYVSVHFLCSGLPVFY